MLIESSYATLYLLALVLFALSITILNILAVEKCTSLTLTNRIGQGQIVNMPIGRRVAPYYVLETAIFAISAPICEIITYEFTNALDSTLTL